MKLFRKFRSPSASLIVFTSALIGDSPVYGQGNVDGYILGGITAGVSPLGGATVAVSSVDTGASRTADTSASGSYRFPRLATGAYTVSVTASGYRSAAKEVIVNIGQGAPINFNLVPDIVEEIVVTGASVAPVDVTLAETMTAFAALEVERLPIARDIMRLR